jgi:hypothetical protein
MSNDFNIDAMNKKIILTVAEATKNNVQISGICLKYLSLFEAALKITCQLL